MKMIKDLLQAIVFVVTVIGAAFCIVYTVKYGGQITGAILAFLMLIGLLNYLFDKRAA